MTLRACVASRALAGNLDAGPFLPSAELAEAGGEGIRPSSPVLPLQNSCKGAQQQTQQPLRSGGFLPPPSARGQSVTRLFSDFSCAS